MRVVPTEATCCSTSPPLTFPPSLHVSHTIQSYPPLRQVLKHVLLEALQLERQALKDPSKSHLTGRPAASPALASHAIDLAY